MDYNINFQDNIRYAEFDQKAKGVLDWIVENREKEEWAKDPNAYELANIYLFAGKYAGEKQQIDTDTLKQMWDIRSQDFERCGVSNNSFIYKICEDSYLSAMKGKTLVNDENSHHALRKIAGIGLYLKQQQRDIKQQQKQDVQVDYNNPQELLQLMECSKTLKTFHPDLYDKYRFEQNIDSIMQMQTQHTIPKAFEDRLKQSQEQLHQNIGKQINDQYNLRTIEEEQL